MKINDKIYKKRIRKLEKYVATRLPKETLNEFVQNTPIDTGNARRNTDLKRRGKRGFTIVGDYAYSGVLDKGKYPNPPKQGTGKTTDGYSNQAPTGMIQPTIKWLELTIKKFIRRIK